MNQSYIGIVTAHGLQAIYRESDHLRRTVHQRIYQDRPSSGLCCWAVMPDELLQRIELQLKAGEGQEALLTLQEHAPFLGPILPSSSWNTPGTRETF